MYETFETPRYLRGEIEVNYVPYTNHITSLRRSPGIIGDYSGRHLKIICVRQETDKTHFRHDDLAAHLDAGQLAGLNQVIGFILSDPENFRRFDYGQHFRFVFQHGEYHSFGHGVFVLSCWIQVPD